MEKEHFEVLLEDIQHKMELVLEGHTAIRHEMHALHEKALFRIDIVNTKVDELGREVKDFRKEMKDFRQEMKEFRQELAGQENALTVLDQKIDVVAENLDDHIANTERLRGYQVAE